MIMVGSISIIILISTFASSLLGLLAGLIAGMLAAILLYFMVQARLPAAYTVAVVGLPKSGKTTLITSLFGEIFASNILGIRTVLRGSATIERINENLSLLQKGRALGPTRDQDRFAYRTDVTLSKWIFKRTYKVEFGDFPGDHLEGYLAARSSAPWLHKNEYFKWVVDANALVFVIDLGLYIMGDSEDFVPQISTAIRSAWQHILDFNEGQEKAIRKRPVILAFNKADLAGIVRESRTADRLQELIRDLGFGARVPPVSEIEDEALMELKANVEKDFGELIRYLRAEAPERFRVIFVSSFAMHKGRRLGVSELFRSVLPQ